MATIAALATLAVGAYGAYSANQNQKKGLEQQQQAAQGLQLGKTPDAAEYEPVDFNSEQLAAILGNSANLDPMRDLANNANRMLTTQDLNRARRLIPGYKKMMKLQGQNAQSLLGGQLPYDDVLDIVSDRSSLAGAMGTPGAAAPATMRDLGLKRLDAMNTGAGMMRGMVDIAERISPVARQTRPADFLMNPTDRIRLTMDQNQLIQQSDQSKNNLEAGVSPTSQAQQMMMLSMAGRGMPEPNYAQFAAQALGAVTAPGAFGGSASTPALSTAYAGMPGQYGSTYVGSYGTTPVYRPQNPYSLPA